MGPSYADNSQNPYMDNHYTKGKENVRNEEADVSKDDFYMSLV